jgi:phosphoribosyl-ATP pyrophosphohydrolase
VSRDDEGLKREAADVLYHLLVLLHVSGVSFADVKAELQRRTAQTGLDEKAGRSAA